VKVEVNDRQGFLERYEYTNVRPNQHVEPRDVREGLTRNCGAWLSIASSHSEGTVGRSWTRNEADGLLDLESARRRTRNLCPTGSHRSAYRAMLCAQTFRTNVHATATVL